MKMTVTVNMMPTIIIILVIIVIKLINQFTITGLSYTGFSFP